MVHDDGAERDRLRRFEQLVELSDEGIAELAADGTLRYANQRLAQMLGRSVEDLVGRAARELLHDDPDRVVAGWLERWEHGDGDVVRTTVRLRRPSGEPLWCQASARVMRDTGGLVTGVVAVVVDIDQQVQDAQQLDRSRRLLEQAQQLARIGTWQADLTDRTLRWGEPVYAMFGVDPATFSPTADAFLAMVHPDDRTAVLGTNAGALRAGERIDLTYRIVRPDGAVRVVHELGDVIEDDRGHLHTTGIVQDITDRSEAQQALRASEDRLQQVMAATNDGWWDIDLRTGERFHSDRWLAIHGFRSGDLPDGADPWRSLMHPDDLREIDEVVAAAVAGRQPTFSVTARVRHRGGHELPVLIRGRVHYGPDGTPIRMTGATSDITEVRQADIAKEQFVSTVSHELRTPLTSIGGAIELASAGVAGPISPPLQRLLDIAARNTARLRSLIDDLLDVERLRSGSLPFLREPHDLTALLRAAVADHLTLGASRRIGFSAAAVHPGPIVVIGDRQRLGQVVANLLSNAVKHAPDGSTVDVRTRTLDGLVRTEVVDRGLGVPASIADRIFDRFVQADPSDRRARGGTGLGLAISREIVDQHDGQMGFDQEPGCTVFWFDLPTVEPTVA